MEMKNPNWKLNQSNADSWLAALLPRVYLQNDFAATVLPHVSQRPLPSTSSTTDHAELYSLKNLHVERL